jgi:hypothetical protein
MVNEELKRIKTNNLQATKQNQETKLLVDSIKH